MVLVVEGTVGWVTSGHEVGYKVGLRLVAR